MVMDSLVHNLPHGREIVNCLVLSSFPQLFTLLLVTFSKKNKNKILYSLIEEVKRKENHNFYA